MMWGPGVARIGADLALEGTTEVTDATGWGMDRFDDEGRSPSYDPIALPFPVTGRLRRVGASDDLCLEP